MGFTICLTHGGSKKSDLSNQSKNGDESKGPSEVACKDSHVLTLRKIP